MIRARAWSLHCDSYDDANAVETLGVSAVVVMMLVRLTDATDKGGKPASFSSSH